MKIRKISKSYGRTVNLGNYQTARFGATLEADIEEKEDVKEVSKILQKGVQYLVDKDIKLFEKDRK